MKILVVYYSRYGSTKTAARFVAQGVEQVGDAQAILRTVPEISANHEATQPRIPETGDVYVSNKELSECDGIIVGSPAYFGNMASPLKYWIESTSADWMKGSLINKPAAFFTGATSIHGGHESTLLSMMLPFFHHGALMVGLPYSVPALGKTLTGGTPYGASHLSSDKHARPLDENERELHMALGQRVATLAKKLKGL